VIARKARFKSARTIERACGCRIPDAAFNGATLEVLLERVNIDRLGGTLREQVLAFIHDFLNCRCRSSPFCGCPERKFAEKVIEFRENGLDHKGISSVLLDEYGIDLFPADILAYLEDTVHVLEAISDVARISGKKEMESRADEHIALIER
jgi:superfamily II helicase